MNYIMVLGGALAFASGSAVTGGAFTITTPPVATAFVDSKGIFAGPLAWTFAGGNGAGCDPGTVAGAGTIQPGSVSSKVDGLAVVLEGDSASAVFAGTAGGTPVSLGPQTVEVSSAGQTSMKAD